MPSSYFFTEARNTLILNPRYVATADLASFSWSKTMQNRSVLVQSAESPKPVVLTMVIEVDGHDSELRSDGGYQRPTRSISGISAVQLRVVGRCPARHTDFQEHYKNALAKLDYLLDSQRIPYIGWKGDGLTFNDFGDFYGVKRKISFIHKLFEPRPLPLTSELASNMVPEGYFDQYDCWSTSGWPVKSPRARKELRAIVGSYSHSVVPLPLEVERALLSGPESYERELPGKVMIVRFTLSHVVNAEEQIDHFEGEIESLEPILPWD